jgi:hypothetical protein
MASKGLQSDRVFIGTPKHQRVVSSEFPLTNQVGESSENTDHDGNRNLQIRKHSGFGRNLNIKNPPAFIASSVRINFVTFGDDVVFCFQAGLFWSRSQFTVLP